MYESSPIILHHQAPNLPLPGALLAPSPEQTGVLVAEPLAVPPLRRSSGGRSWLSLAGKSLQIKVTGKSALFLLVFLLSLMMEAVTGRKKPRLIFIIAFH